MWWSQYKTEVLCAAEMPNEHRGMQLATCIYNHTCFIILYNYNILFCVVTSSKLSISPIQSLENTLLVQERKLHKITGDGNCLHYNSEERI